MDDRLEENEEDEDLFESVKEVSKEVNFAKGSVKHQQQQDRRASVGRGGKSENS